MGKEGVGIGRLEFFFMATAAFIGITSPGSDPIAALLHFHSIVLEKFFLLLFLLLLFLLLLLLLIIIIIITRENFSAKHFLECLPSKLLRSF